MHERKRGEGCEMEGTMGAHKEVWSGDEEAVAIERSLEDGHGDGVQLLLLLLQAVETGVKKEEATRSTNETQAVTGSKARKSHSSLSSCSITPEGGHVAPRGSLSSKALLLKLLIAVVGFFCC